MITVQKTTTSHHKINHTLLKLAIRNTLSYFDRSDVAITLRLTNDAEMKALNQAYRDIPTSTDVLSFNQDFFDPDTQQYYLGDIVISLERAAQQAPEHHMTIDQECAFLAIHGTLHLLDYDHYEPDQKVEMWQLQDTIFQETIKKFQEKRN